jgi:hypothetical protein
MSVSDERLVELLDGYDLDDVKQILDAKYNTHLSHR